MGLFIFFVGVMILRAGWSERALFLYESKAIVEAPGSPWLWRKEWAENDIRSSVTTMGRVGLFVAFFGNLFIVFVVSAMISGEGLSPKAQAMTEFRFGMSVLLISIGGYLLWSASRHLSLLKKYSAAKLCLSSNPLRRGEDHYLELTLDPRMKFDSALTYTLECRRDYNDERTVSPPLWKNSIPSALEARRQT